MFSLQFPPNLSRKNFPSHLADQEVGLDHHSIVDECALGGNVVPLLLAAGVGEDTEVGEIMMSEALTTGVSGEFENSAHAVLQEVLCMMTRS